MTEKVTAVSAKTPLVQAVDIIIANDFSGLPVVDDDKVLIGIVTDYDLILKGSSIHLPTFLTLLKEFQIYKKDASLIKEDIKKILEMKVGDVMNKEPLVLFDDSTINDAINAFGQHHRVNPIPIIDRGHHLVGIISRLDMLKLYGAPSVNFARHNTKRDIDQNINLFLSDFEKQFVLVSKTRTHYWLIFSLVFAIIGFIIAFAIILRIEF
ncbi:MAG: CBS domain-containing protein [bacterium]|nr:CBS domain-containing protein [bacterium]